MIYSKKEQIKALRQFNDATRVLSQMMQDDNTLGSIDYPFEHSFDEIALDIVYWTEANIKERI